MPKYKFINASDSVYSFPTSKGSAIVQPHTRRVLEIDEELTDAKIAKLASSGLIVSKSGEHAQNVDPMSPFEPELSDARKRLMVVSGQERADLIAEISNDKKSKKSSPATKASTDAGGASPAPSTTPAPAAATTGAAGTTPTSTAGR